MALTRREINQRYYASHKSEERARRKVWFDAHPAYQQSDEIRWNKADWYTRNKYGISFGSYLQLVKQQQGKCAICNLVPTEGNRDAGGSFLEIDHDHITGAIRGLLCHGCNKALGLFGDSAESLDRASQYIRERKDKPLEIPESLVNEERVLAPRRDRPRKSVLKINVSPEVAEAIEKNARSRQWSRGRFVEKIYEMTRDMEIQ